MDTSKFTGGTQLFRVVGWVDGGVGNAEMRSGKCYHSLVLGVCGSSKITKNGLFFSHNYGPSLGPHRYVLALRLSLGELFRRLAC